jgi:hypothetical protein
LDFNVTKSIGQKLEVRFSAQDISTIPVRLEQDFNRDGNITGSDNQPIRQFRRGAYFTLGLNYNFNRKTLTPTTN